MIEEALNDVRWKRAGIVGKQKIQVTEIDLDHSEAMGRIIREVSAEFGATGPGFGSSDVEVSQLFQSYGHMERKLYLIALLNGKLVGGCGIAPLNESSKVCELRKLFLRPQARGLGIGRFLVESCLEYARLTDYELCYLDTLSTMTSAIKLYESLGFVHAQRMTGTEHAGCDIYMSLHL